jgi:hypothetical protein
MRRPLALLAIVTFGVLASVSTAHADVTTNSTVPVDIVVLVPCTGDLVELTGQFHVLVSVTANGNHLAGRALVQPQGVTGIDLATGASYQGTGQTLTRFSETLTNGVAQETFVNNFKLIGQGSVPNYLVHENTHVTIRPDGSATAIVDSFSISCG